MKKISIKEETRFEKRFNLKYNRSMIRLRVLDEDISKSLDINCKRLSILENKTSFSNVFNFLTIPNLNSSISIFGKGFGLGLLKGVDWLRDKEIYYWGNISERGLV